MKYDIIAAFYEKAKAKEPTYRCPLGVFCPPTLNFFEENGFSKTKESTPGYSDYKKTVSSDELEDWTQEGYVSEVMDVLYCGTDFKRIELRAEELDYVDKKGGIPVRGLPISECFVEFGTTEPLSQVTFMEGCPYTANENARRFHIPLKKMKEYFGVLTTMEVIERMWTLANGAHWPFDVLKEYFESGVDDAVGLISKVYFGKRDKDGTPKILHALSVGMRGKNKTEIIAGFLHGVVEDSKTTIEDLSIYGYSKDVIDAVELLTDNKDIPYEEYITKILSSGNLTAIGVKINDLRDQLAREQAGKHKDQIEQLKSTLDTMLDGTRETCSQ